MNLSDVLNVVLELKKNIELSNQISNDKQRTLLEALGVLEDIIDLEQ